MGVPFSQFQCGIGVELVVKERRKGLVMNKYQLVPLAGRKSFYWKAVVVKMCDGCEFLESYGTVIMSRSRDGVLVRHWNDGWTATTGRHINAFCGLNKKGFMALPYVKIN